MNSKTLLEAGGKNANRALVISSITLLGSAYFSKRFLHVMLGVATGSFGFYRAYWQHKTDAQAGALRLTQIKEDFNRLDHFRATSNLEELPQIMENSYQRHLEVAIRIFKLSTNATPADIPEDRLPPNAIPPKAPRRLPSDEEIDRICDLLEELEAWRPEVSRLLKARSNAIMGMWSRL